MHAPVGRAAFAAGVVAGVADLVLPPRLAIEGFALDGSLSAEVGSGVAGGAVSGIGKGAGLGRYSTWRRAPFLWLLDGAFETSGIGYSAMHLNPLLA